MKAHNVSLSPITRKGEHWVKDTRRGIPVWRRVIAVAYEERRAKLRAHLERRRLMHMANTNHLRMAEKYGHDHWKTRRALYAYGQREYAYRYPEFA